MQAGFFYSKKVIKKVTKSIEISIFAPNFKNLQQSIPFLLLKKLV